MKKITLFFFLVVASFVSAQTTISDSVANNKAETKSIVKTQKVDSALIQLSNSLTRLGESINKLVAEAGLNVEKAADKVDKNLKEENVLMSISRALDKAAKSIEDAADKVQRKIDDSASRKKSN
jgi:hypothetical protein